MVFSTRETRRRMERKFIVLKIIVLLVASWLSLAVTARASTLAPGLYAASGHTMYVGVEHELPDPPSNDFFDPSSQRTGDLRPGLGLHLQSGISEERRIVVAPEGRLAFSLYFAGEKPRATVILIHGNDPESREMGFIIPFLRA